MAMPIISLQQVTKTYAATTRGQGASHVALDAIDLDIPRGTIFGIIGASGAGKSTLVRLINLLERPDSGAIRVNGRDSGTVAGGELLKLDFIRNQARPWIDSGKDSAPEDSYTIGAIGDLAIRLNAAEALLDRAGALLDATIADTTLETIALAKVATAEAKVLTPDAALLATSKLFELGGSRSTLGRHGLDRRWRDARTHTLHDPVRWKYHAVGQFYLTRVHPPLHSWI